MDAQVFLLEALALAKAAALAGEVPVGAVIVQDGRIIGRGANTREADQDPLGHAEISAIREAAKNLGSWRLIDCDLYVTKEPCPMCAGAAYWTRVGRIVFGASDPKRGFRRWGETLEGRILHPTTVVEGGVLAEECGELVRAFFRARR